jgi:hypothetical protein
LAPIAGDFTVDAERKSEKCTLFAIPCAMLQECSVELLKSGLINRTVHAFFNLRQAAEKMEKQIEGLIFK